MSERVWYRSLYWRIAVGFVALLALLLIAQGVLFLWLAGRLDESPQGRTAQQTADFVARELSDALTADPSLNLDRFIRERVGTVHRPFSIVMRDGRRASNRPDALPPNFMEGRGRGGRGGLRPPPPRPPDSVTQGPRDPATAPGTQGLRDPDLAALVPRSRRSS